MYSEAFFLVLRDSWKNLKTTWSDKEIEHILYKELRSEPYRELRKAYLEDNCEFPAIKLTNCPILEKNLSFLTKNNATLFSLEE